MARFPQHLHKPLQVLEYEPDEMGLFMVMFTLSMVFGGKALWLSTFLLPYGYRRFKVKYPRGFVKHIFYFLGIATIKGYPIFFQKEFRE